MGCGPSKDSGAEAVSGGANPARPRRARPRARSRPGPTAPRPRPPAPADRDDLHRQGRRRRVGAGQGPAGARQVPIEAGRSARRASAARAIGPSSDRAGARPSAQRAAPPSPSPPPPPPPRPTSPDRAHPPTPPHHPITQDVSGAYNLGKVLGRGQFGTTRLAECRTERAAYACKSIAKRKLACREDVEDVQREVQIMHHLKGHPNVTYLRDTFEDRQHVHLVMNLAQVRGGGGGGGGGASRERGRDRRWFWGVQNARARK